MAKAQINSIGQMRNNNHAARAARTLVHCRDASLNDKARAGRAEIIVLFLIISRVNIMISPSASQSSLFATQRACLEKQKDVKVAPHAKSPNLFGQ